MKKIVTVDGNEACSNSAYLFTEISGIYPITPSSPMAEHIEEWSAAGKKNIFGETVKIVEMQSEAGAAGFVHGSLQSGCLTSTYTASQGLLLMIPNMYKIAGEMLPCVIHVAARSLATHALSIFGDHQDIYAARMTGFAMLSSSNVQDAAYLSSIAHLSTIESSIPFIHFFDGFRTSHEINKIEILEDEDYKEMVNYKKIEEFRNRALNPNKPITRGTCENDDIYFQATEVRNKYYDAVPDVVNDYMGKLNKKAGTNYKPFNYYGNKEATKVIVAMGSVCNTIKETIDYIGGKIGLIEVHLYRPFSTKYLLDVLPNTVEKIAVLDRTKEAGSIGEPLYLDIVAALKDKKIEIVGGRYGLSSKDTTPRDIKAVYDSLDNPKNHFTIGINDDVTNLSLKSDEYFKINKHHEILIYGYGSDGMVSASKSLIKIIGDNTDNNVQGYFQYDSKKSGGVTVSNLRFSMEEIKSTYYVESPEIIMVTHDTYMNEFDTIDAINENGIFILNTIKNKEEVIETLSDKVKQIIKEKNIKFYIINAYDIARKVGLNNKISTIMENVLLYLSNIMDYEEASKKLKESIKKKFSKKGEEIVNANYEAIDTSIKGLIEINNNELTYNEIKEEKDNKNLYEALKRRKGDKIPVSAFLENPDGSFEAGTSVLDKRCSSDIVPFWMNENCIQCNMCSTYCPHGVIRPFLLSDSEYANSPEYVKEKCIKAIGTNYYYILGISVSDCTGCMVCAKSCPGKAQNKALESQKLSESLKSNTQKIFDYLDKNITEKKEININNIKNSQFKKPKFMFHGACSGCGETAYIKLLTQLYGENLIIANATGCSSIYGGSIPTTPYQLPWINSLFEDNAEFSYGILQANEYNRNRIENIMKNNMNNENNNLFEAWLENKNNYTVTKEIYEKLDYNTCPEELKQLKEYIPSRVVFAVGGDGWAYDIGYGGIDHVLSTGDNINILVLDTQVYSNTGGQSSKSSPKGSVASFTTNGKKNNKKDLARMALAYPNVYVAQVSMGANPNQVMKVIEEAVNYNGPSIIIAYSSCISHGIKGGMTNSIDMERQAVTSGYFPIFHYNPTEQKLVLDYKNVNFDTYSEFLNNQNRFKMLEKINPENAQRLLEENKNNAIERFNYYKELSEK